MAGVQHSPHASESFISPEKMTVRSKPQVVRQSYCLYLYPYMNILNYDNRRAGAYEKMRRMNRVSSSALTIDRLLNYVPYSRFCFIRSLSKPRYAYSRQAAHPPTTCQQMCFNPNPTSNFKCFSLSCCESQDQVDPLKCGSGCLVGSACPIAHLDKCSSADM